MNSLSPGHYFKISWSDGTKAILNRPILSVGIFALMFIFLLWQSDMYTTASSSLVSYAQARSTARSQHPISFLLYLFATLVLFVQVMRYALLGEGDSGLLAFLKGLWRSWWITLLLTVLLIAVGAATGFVSYLLFKETNITRGHAALSIVVSIIVPVIVDIMIAIRLVFLFSSRAIGDSLPLSSAWALTKGRVWSILLTHLLAIAPIFLLRLLHAGISIVLVQVLSHPNLVLENAAANAVFAMLSIAVGAACSAWLYRDLSANARVLTADA